MMQRPIPTMQTIPPTDSLLPLSTELLLRVRMMQDTDHLLPRLDALALSQVPAQLPDDASRKACWINLYNAWTILQLRKQPEMYTRRQAFFAKRSLRIGGVPFSLNDIEHGILRRGAIWWGLGYLRNPLLNRRLAALQVNAVDPRIHFALNCGAASCPPIRAYTPDDIDAQLDLATLAYLQMECRFEPDRYRIGLPRLLLWFRGDFGGRSGILSMLRRYGIIGPSDAPRFRYLPYDWTLNVRDRE
jgi:hypothetical protein